MDGESKHLHIFAVDDAVFLLEGSEEVLLSLLRTPLQCILGYYLASAFLTVMVGLVDQYLLAHQFLVGFGVLLKKRDNKLIPTVDGLLVAEGVQQRSGGILGHCGVRLCFLWFWRGGIHDYFINRAY